MFVVDRVAEVILGTALIMGALKVWFSIHFQFQVIH